MRPLPILFALVFTAAPLLAAVKTGTVEYKQGDTTLKGYVAYDDAGSGKRPGVLVVPEWWGLNDYAKSRAQQLAKLGYVAFVADMYGDGKTTTDPKQATAWAGPFQKDHAMMRSRVMAGFDQLKGRSEVNPEKTAAIGYCFGGTSVLELAMGGAPVAGVVAFHGGLDFPDAADAKNIKSKVLILTGAADKFVPAEQVGTFEKALTEAKVDWEVIAYANAVHAFTNPNAGNFGIPNIAYDKQADARSFARMIAFFGELFGE